MSATRMKPPTITDVSLAAGVSVASVSRALKDRTGVSQDVYQRVMAAVELVEYRPQRIHRNNTRAPWVLVLVTHIAQQFYLQVISGIQMQADADGLLPVIFRLTNGRDQLSQILKQVRGIPLTGILVLGIEDSTAEDWIGVWEEARVPIVVQNIAISHQKIASVLVNFEGATAQATRHLLDLGHTRIAYLGDHNWSISAAEFRGVQTALAERDLAYPDHYIISVPYTPEGASQGVSRLMGLPEDQRPTAIIAFDDEVAIDILTALRYYNMRVPEDISVVGFDNIPMAAHTYPPLTTVDVPKSRAGRQMVSLLGELERNTASNFGATVLDCSLVMRGSTGPARLDSGSMPSA